MSIEFQSCKIKRVLEANSSGGRTIYLLPLNHTFKNVVKICKFYVIHILSQ